VPLFEMTRENLTECTPVTFAHLEIKERADLQHVLRDHIEVLDSDLRVIAEEYGNWEDSRRRIDLLALDKQQRLVVIELKRTDTGGHMDLQALRYAAMVSAMTFEQVVDAHEAYLAKRALPDAGEAAERIREFLELPPDEDAEISSDVRILLVSGDFSREVTTTVLWLNGFDGMDIRCVRLVAYEIAGKNYLDIEQVIPLPQTVDYQVQIGKKAQQQKKGPGRRRGLDPLPDHYRRRGRSAVAETSSRADYDPGATPEGHQARCHQQAPASLAHARDPRAHGERYGG
jgi:hypothetical protein